MHLLKGILQLHDLGSDSYDKCLARCADIDLNLDGAFGRQPSVAEADPFLAFSSEDLAGMDKEVVYRYEFYIDKLIIG